MARRLNVSVCLGLLLLGASQASAQALGFVHSVSAYTDEKAGMLKAPEGVAVSGKEFVVADTGNARLVRFQFHEGNLSGGTELKFAQLPYPVRVQLSAKGELYVLDQRLRRVGRVSADGKFSGFVEPKGVTNPANVMVMSFKLDAAGNLYLLDMAAPRLLVLDPEGTLLRTLELPKGGAIMDVCVDPRGVIFAIDGINAQLYSAEKGAKSFVSLGRSLKEYMSFPTYLATNNKGLLLVVDGHGGGLVLLGQDGAFRGRQLSLGWTEGLVQFPGQIAIDGAGVLFVADRDNNRVQVFEPAR